MSLISLSCAMASSIDEAKKWELVSVGSVDEFHA
jgi:hypothetical protein